MSRNTRCALVWGVCFVIAGIVPGTLFEETTASTLIISFVFGIGCGTLAGNVCERINR